MDEDGNFTDLSENVTQIGPTESETDVMMILSSTTASLGIISNLTVVIVFLRDKKLRTKIPNIFIINQVSIELFYNKKVLLPDHKGYLPSVAHLLFKMGGGGLFLF